MLARIQNASELVYLDGAVHWVNESNEVTEKEVDGIRQ